MERDCMILIAPLRQMHEPAARAHRLILFHMHADDGARGYRETCSPIRGLMSTYVPRSPGLKGQAPPERIVFLEKLAGQLVTEAAKIAVPVGHFGLPFITLDPQERVDRGLLEPKVGRIERFDRRHPANRRFPCGSLIPAALGDPLQNPQALAEPRPEEFPCRVLAEPVDMKNPGHSLLPAASHLE